MPFDSNKQAAGKRAKVNMKSNEKTGIVMYCKSQSEVCPHPVKIGEIEGQEVFGCPKVIKRLKNGLVQDAKISNYSLQRKPLDSKDVKGFYQCVATILDLFEEETPEVINKVILKLIGIGKVTETVAKAGKLDSQELRNLRYETDIKLKKIEGSKRSERAVHSQKRVGDYIYKQQKSPRGGPYWYLLELKDKKNKLYYLGKEEPKFIPEDDLKILKQKQKRKAEISASR